MALRYITYIVGLKNMFCKICEKEVEPEYIERAESWGNTRTHYCPKCHTYLGLKMVGKNTTKHLASLKEILKTYHLGKEK
jgi:hypothetical protein